MLNSNSKNVYINVAARPGHLWKVEGAEIDRQLVISMDPKALNDIAESLSLYWEIRDVLEAAGNEGFDVRAFVSEFQLFEPRPW